MKQDQPNDPGQTSRIGGTRPRIRRKRKRFAGSDIKLDEDDPWCLKLRKARLRAGLTQSELADYLKVSRTTICLWEKGMTFPIKKKFDAIETILNETLFVRNDSTYEPSRPSEHLVLLRVFHSLPNSDRAKVLGFATNLASQNKTT